MKHSFFALALIAALLPADSLAQKPASVASKASAAKIEPLRTAGGVMKDQRITVRRSDWINRGAPWFDYTLARARIVGGRLEFTGSLREAGKRKAQTVTATLLATSARGANPWPNPGSPTAREYKPTQKNLQPEGAPGAVNEQTQSLYSAAEPGSGCELLYLSMRVPNHPVPLQVGVVLAPRDNEAGHQINQAVCHLVRAMQAPLDTDEALAKLNRLLGGE